MSLPSGRSGPPRAAQRALAATLALPAMLHAQPAAFRSLGILDQYGVSGLSADGTTVVAGAGRWTAATGWVALPPPPGITAWVATAVCADGSAIGGQSTGVVNVAVRWTQAGGPVTLGTLSGYSDGIQCRAISDDGSILTGFAQHLSDTCYGGAHIYDTRGWRWDSAGSAMQEIHPASGLHESAILALSGDGATMAGVSSDRPSCTTFPTPAAYVWRGTGAAAFVPVGPFTWLQPTAASHDSAVIVGTGPVNGQLQAFRWTAVAGTTDLGALAGYGNVWQVVASADGSVLAGYCDSASGGGRVAFIWDQAHGMRDLRAILTNLGLDLSAWVLEDVAGISADGRTIVGNGGDSSGHNVGWLAFLGDPISCYPNCDASTAPPILNVNDFACFLNRFAAGDTRANCDGSTAPPALNVLDFSCFLNAFAAGCS